MAGANTIPIDIYADTSRATTNVRRFNRELDKTGKEAREAITGLRGVELGTQGVEAASQAARKVLGKLAAAFSAVAIGRFAIGTGEAADKVALLEQRLTTLSGETGGFDRIFQLSQRLGQSLDTTADVFARFTLGTRDLSITSDEVEQLTETVFQLGRIGGSASQEIANATLQLGQALASGRLQGDELRSVLENLPLVGIQIADSLGVSVGALRDLGAEGKLTAEVVSGALLSGAEDVAEQFAALPRTMAQSRAELGNEWTLTLAAMGRELKSSDIYRFITSQIQESLQALRIQIEGPTGTEREQVDAKLSTARAEKARLDLEIAELQRKKGGGDQAASNRAALIRDLKQERHEQQGLIVDLRGQLAVLEDQEALRNRLRDNARTDGTFGSREPKPYSAPAADLEVISLREQSLVESQAREREIHQEALLARAESLRTQALTEEQIIIESHERRQQLIRDLSAAGYEQEARQAELDALTLHEEEKTAVLAREAAKRRDEEQQAAEEALALELQRRQAISQASRGFAALAAEMSGRNTALAKAAAIADATVHTYMAANRALASGVPPWSHIAAAGVIAAGLANVARIRSQPTPRASGGDVTAGEAYRVSEMSPEVFTDSSGKSYLIPQGSGRVEPLGATSHANGGVNVVMQNHGTNARIGGAQMLDAKTLQIVLEMAEDNVRASFDEELQQGHGSFSSSLQRHTNVRRLIR